VVKEVLANKCPQEIENLFTAHPNINTNTKTLKREGVALRSTITLPKII